MKLLAGFWVRRFVLVLVTASIDLVALGLARRGRNAELASVLGWSVGAAVLAASVSAFLGRNGFSVGSCSRATRQNLRARVKVVRLLEKALCQLPNKQFERTAIPNRWRAACAPFHYTRAARRIRGHTAAQLRR